MSDDTITHTPAKENPWYKLAIMSNADKPSNYFWNGYMRELMKYNGKSAEADEVKVRVGYFIPDGSKKDCKEVSLPKLTPDELRKVQAINGLPQKLNQISFEGCDFDNGAKFVVFTSFYFPTNVSFVNTRLPISAYFDRAKFADRADFKNASFADSADFENASFADSADFKNAIFAGKSNFSKANFADSADFKNTSFAGVANFSDASFADRAIFSDASFAGFAGFNNANFAGRSYFSKAKFECEADFSASSDTPPHKGSVSFAGATFKQAPFFFERQLHEDTDWQDAIWPRRYGRLSPMMSRLKKYYDYMLTFFCLLMEAKEIRDARKKQAGDDVRRYERLSLMMSRLEKYDDMHTFFRLSMRAKEIRDGWSVASFMSRTYGTLFDYGWGVGRAFGLWAFNILVGFVLICINGSQQSIDVEQSLALSFSNAHSFIGMHSGAQANLYDAAGDIPWFNVIWGTQTVFGLFFLFFLLLTIRNRFRMR